MEPEERFTRIELALDRIVEVQTVQGKNLESLTGLLADVFFAQQKTEQELAALAIAQAKLAEVETRHREDQEDITDKLNLLFKIVENWIREHGGKNGNTEPSPAG